MTPEFSKEEHPARIRWLLWSRPVLATILVGTLIFLQQKYTIYAFHTVYLVYFLFTVYVLTTVYWYLLRNIANLQFHSYLQASGDILLITALVYLTGGVDSGFSLLYFLTIISASIILYRRGGYLSASLSGILYGAMLDMQYYNMPGFTRSVNYTAVQVLFRVFINILSFYSVALLTGYLSERLKKTRQELREKSIDFDDLRVLQDHILRGVGSGILTLELQGTIASWNPAAERITGYGYDEIKNNWKDIFGDSIKGVFGHTDRMKVRPYRFNGKITKKDGSVAVLDITASLLTDDAQAVRGIILIFQDITKILEMEEQVRRQDRMATIGSLAAGIAHEIRNPLASLSGSIQVLQGDLDLKADDKHLMEIVVKETDRLNKIITDFLEYARPRTDQAEHVDIALLISETVLLLKNSRDLPPNMKISLDLGSKNTVVGDPQRLRQVIWNLIVNACQAMPNGGEASITVRPVVSLEDDRAWCEILVSDTGAGISPDCLDKVFDPFFTTKTGGTGLGLAIAYRIIEDHGGVIVAASDSGKGTQFRVKLPLSGSHTGLKPPEKTVTRLNADTGAAEHE